MYKYYFLIVTLLLSSCVKVNDDDKINHGDKYYTCMKNNYPSKKVVEYEGYIKVNLDDKTIICSEYIINENKE